MIVSDEQTPLPVALITGASMGIGRALASEFAGKGHHLLLVARSGDLLEAFACELRKNYGIKVFCSPSDLAEADGPDRVFSCAFDHRLSVRYLINCAGMSRASEFNDLSFCDLDAIIAVNVLASVKLIRLFLPGMLADRTGMIVNIASLGGAQGIPGLALYSATKSFMITLTEALHVELDGTGVGVAAVCPGFVDTDFLEKAGHSRRGIRLPIYGTATVVRAVSRCIEKRHMLVYPTITDYLLVFIQRFAPRSFVVRLSGFLAAARKKY
ncbi:MAG: SDR family NAD(P)-dependent oxidoreductase [Chlorobium sp.]|jgi:short-subunit dehydrogenase|uniref:SDR family NAD(P)-dependent oxidoreductase n=1 Tax=Chlorobium sp. TaxID=1095 RepID=UPI001D4329B1|nr:SDR family NAD(P)-dependent oxidoreductase [Chlorobium sp.]MBN1279866.1 SDR family NAD(P)-dependent oxidoreductase [Chlorobiaceae bacterium]MCF8215792.1 SDR family NAD(P)-dependent oxidoreductase [Chlorobium sp.]MCF8270612.1 SDR family NAD(P)-dependent oxidoreductase [Chlorobium sp.]MCF8287002.1 SDR family NAD(P)-dependent oxidoreductase [Chlorobium sp.]MCF8290659.1 SDR family NAD(P)-dependent oxidoreductase [Chlorobium sp.]